MSKTLYRSRTDRMIGGVCGGLAEYADIDPVLVRLGAVLLAVVTQGVAVAVYIVMMIVVPEGPEDALAPEPVEEAMMDEGMGSGDMPEPGEFASEAAQESAAPPAPPYPPAPPAPPAPQYAQPPAHRRGRGGVFAGMVLILVGAAFLAAQFLPAFDVWRLWPLIVIAVGVSILFKRGRD